MQLPIVLACAALASLTPTDAAERPAGEIRITLAFRDLRSATQAFDWPPR